MVFVSHPKTMQNPRQRGIAQKVIRKEDVMVLSLHLSTYSGSLGWHGLGEGHQNLFLEELKPSLSRCSGW